MPSAVTIATNMAGRGTDIQLGGNLEMRLGAEGEKLSDKKRDEIIADVEEKSHRTCCRWSICRGHRTP